MSQWDCGMPPPDHHDPYPITWEQEPAQAAGSDVPATQRLGLGLPGEDRPWEDWLDEDWLAGPPRRGSRDGRGWQVAWRGRGRRGRRGGRGRWLVSALVAVGSATVGAAVVLTGGHPGGMPAAGRSAAPPRLARPVQDAPRAAGPGPLTMVQASQVLAAYTSANNAANAQRSDTVLATIETGSSYAIDSGIYRMQEADNEAPYPAFGPRRARYYIPRETGYPRWFVVQVSNADLASPAKITGTEYLLFTQATPGARWKNAVEPYVVAGPATPQVAVGAGGLATPVTAATPLTVPLGQLAQVTASSLDGAGPLPNPGNLADLMDQSFWRSQLPASSITDSHAPGGSGMFGLATAGGGALLFYTDAAELTLTAPTGEVMRLTVPGYYSPGQALTRAGIGYLEQFASYDPPPGASGLRVVADYSGITSAS